MKLALHYDGVFPMIFGSEMVTYSIDRQYLGLCRRVCSTGYEVLSEHWKSLFG